jgi:hypothetical protein
MLDPTNATQPSPMVGGQSNTSVSVQTTREFPVPGSMPYHLKITVWVVEGVADVDARQKRSAALVLPIGNCAGECPKFKWVPVGGIAQLYPLA